MLAKHPQHVNHVQMDTFITSVNSTNFSINILLFMFSIEFNTCKIKGKKSQEFKVIVKIKLNNLSTLCDSHSVPCPVLQNEWLVNP